MKPGTRVTWTESRTYITADGDQIRKFDCVGKIMKQEAEFSTVKMSNGILKKVPSKDLKAEQ